MSKKEYVQQYVKCLDDALKGLYDEARESEILKADRDALGEDYDQFESVISKAYDKVSEAKDLLKKYSDTL